MGQPQEEPAAQELRELLDYLKVYPSGVMRYRVALSMLGALDKRTSTWARP